MNSIPDLREIPDLPEEIELAARSGDLVFFVGSGASRLLGLPSWDGMANSQLQYLKAKGLLNYSEIEQLSTLDAKKQLSIAAQIAKENGHKLDLTRDFLEKTEKSSIYELINEIGCVCVTTNYDRFLTPRSIETTDVDTTPPNTNRVFKKDELLGHHLDIPGTVVHLHGSIDDPKSMICTTVDYLAHYEDSTVKEFLAQLFSDKTVLFVGCGLEEAEVMEHVLRHGCASPSLQRKTFALQGYFRSQKPLYERMHAYYRGTFGVHSIGFIRDHKNFHQQEEIFQVWKAKLSVSRPSLVSSLQKINRVLDGE